ncbi:MAG: hypothetical protein Q8S84_06315 [bacterium]|nr:hypothetical protein [bacterium]
MTNLFKTQSISFLKILSCISLFEFNKVIALFKSSIVQFHNHISTLLKKFLTLTLFKLFKELIFIQ